MRPGFGEGRSDILGALLKGSSLRLGSVGDLRLRHEPTRASALGMDVCGLFPHDFWTGCGLPLKLARCCGARSSKQSPWTGLLNPDPPALMVRALDMDLSDLYMPGGNNGRELQGKEGKERSRKGNEE